MKLDKIKFKQLSYLTILAGLIVSCTGTDKKESPLVGEYPVDVKKSPVDYEFHKAIETVNFAIDSTKINDKEVAFLTKTLDRLEKAPDDSLILVKGHTDTEGPKLYNERLALDRAMAVKKILVKIGVPEKRIRIRSFGEREPIFENPESSVQQAMNRRATVEIISPDYLQQGITQARPGNNRI